MKKLTALFLTVLLLLGLFAGCGSDTETSAETAESAEPELAEGCYTVADSDRTIIAYLRSTGRTLALYFDTGAPLLPESRFVWDADEEVFTIDGLPAFTLSNGKKKITMTVSEDSPLGIGAGKYTLKEIDEDEMPVDEAAAEEIIDPNELPYGDGFTTEEVGDDGSKVISEYDGNATLVKATNYDADGNILLTVTYTYDENTRCILEDRFLGNADEYSFWNECLYEYAYDEAGNLTILDATFLKDGEPVARQLQEYRYDAAGTMIGETDYSYGSEEDPEIDGTTLVSRSEYEFDANGNETRLTEYDAAGNVWNLLECFYDENDRRIKVVFYDNDGSVSRTEDMAYDDDGNLISDIFYDADGNLDYYWEYTFDEQGNPTSETMFNSDGKILEFYAYSYDDYGYSTGYVIGTYTYNDDGTVLDLGVMEYDGDYNLTREAHFDANGELTDETLY